MACPLHSSAPSILWPVVYAILMNRQAWKRTHMGKVTAITLLLLVAVGLCLIHVDHHVGTKDGMCPDPCAKMASTLVLLLLSLPLLNGRVSFKPLHRLYTISLHLLDPPPRALPIR